MLPAVAVGASIIASVVAVGASIISVGAAAGAVVAVAAGGGVAVGSPPQAASNMEPIASIDTTDNRFLLSIDAFLLKLKRYVIILHGNLFNVDIHHLLVICAGIHFVSVLVRVTSIKWYAKAAAI